MPLTRAKVANVARSVTRAVIAARTARGMALNVPGCRGTGSRERNLPRNRKRFQASQGSNGLESWPDRHLFGDILANKGPRSPPAHIPSQTPLLRLYITPPSTEESTSTALLASFVHDFLPRRIRPRSHAYFFRFSYTYDLAPCYPALLNACLACSAHAIGVKLGIAQEARIKADDFYARSIRALRATIQHGACDGTEDWLVSGQVFRERARRKLDATSRGGWYPSMSALTRSTLVFDRIFTESFLYHSLLISIRDKSLSPLQDPTLRPVFDTYLEHCQISVSPEPENWPIFGMPYPLVRLFSDLVASLHHSPTAFGVQNASGLQDILVQLETWESDAAMIHNDGFLHITLYISAAKLLAYCHLSASSNYYSVLIQHELEDCLDPHASRLVQQKLAEMALGDPSGKKAYDWVAEGFEQKLNPGRLLTTNP
ncbi:hypothetical protein AYL99_09208 [Fonsecaea erecta]|uniref:Uncharacterized protein n=1 Tax=Fonsecaea erecta TaxID=1367422 RepID=A0A178ZDE4_9EURO|nr:hypothetical protein AYL99_09208 [Fonsecaea erecta]OAP57095.1 hypothetical protein AYL99_09208 [Fonsecaea erecta]